MTLVPAPRELIVVATPEAGLQAATNGISSSTKVSLDSIKELITSENVGLQPVFGLSEELADRRLLLSSELSESRVAPSHFYKVIAPESRLEQIAQKFRESELVHAAFIKPGVELPLRTSGRSSAPKSPPLVTPDFVDLQRYLGPEGVDAIAVRNLPGADGEGISIIDIEGAWRFTHEDLVQNQGGVAGGTETGDADWRNHGTAVIGILSGDRNSFGITGICPQVNVRGVSVYGQPLSHFPSDSGAAAAIRQAADLLRPGDIMVIEMHAPGPTVSFTVQEDQQGYIPIEWWPDNFVAIAHAVGKGVIVVAAAGNGSCDLDDSVFEINPSPPHGPFPDSWKNPFHRANADSGSILVGAGAPTRGLNGSDWGPSLSRMAFSNFGSNVDAQGWGQEVTTTGFGNLQQGPDEDRWYTPDFGGTSSATPMVAAALAAVQGALLAAGRPLLTPATARNLLRTVGAAQVDADPSANRPRTQQIGRRPNIREMLNHLGLG